VTLPHNSSGPSSELEDAATDFEPSDADLKDGDVKDSNPCNSGNNAAPPPLEAAGEALDTDPATGAAQSGHNSTAADNDALIDAEHPRQRMSRGQVGAYILLPLVVMLMAAVAGHLKYQDNSIRDAQTAAMSSVLAAKEGTIALLSYTPETAQATLTAARDRLTGSFRDSYTSLTNDVVIPGAKQKRISATATVPAASSVSANPNRAVVLVFVDQSVIVGNDAPSGTASTVQVTLDKIGDRWLISGFDPK